MERKIKIALLALLALTLTGCEKDESWRAKVDFTTECGDSSAERKALATLKIAQLIDVAYGGIVTADEHQYDEAWVYAITYDHNSKHYPFEIILAEKSHDLLSFHSADYDNAERFLCYNEDLVRDFYMMPRKEDEK